MPLLSLLPGIRHPGLLVPMRFFHCTTMFCLSTHGLQFVECYIVHEVKRAKIQLPIWTFAKVCSGLLCTIHNNGPLRALPNLAGVHLATIPISFSTLCTRITGPVVLKEGGEKRNMKCLWVPLIPITGIRRVIHNKTHIQQNSVCL
jgi:hypothetical protein